MTKEELLTVFSDILKEKAILKTAGIHEVNHRPHPYTVGAKHVAYAADHNSGILSEEICMKIQCEHPGCHLPYDEHTSDKTLFLQLTRDTNNTEANEELLKIKPALLENKIDGVAFVDTEEKYRFLKDGEESTRSKGDSDETV